MLLQIFMSGQLTCFIRYLEISLLTPQSLSWLGQMLHKLYIGKLSNYQQVTCMPSKKLDVVSEAKLLYVGMTRSTEKLLLTAHCETEFTKRIMSS